MFSKSTTTLAALVAFTKICSAAPQYFFAPITCDQDDWVVVDSQTQKVGDSFGFESTVSAGQRKSTLDLALIASLTRSPDLTFTSTHSVGTTWTYGASFDVSKIIGVGLSASVAETVTQGSSSALGADCPGPGAWTCSATLAPSVLEVNGHWETKCLNADGSAKEPFNYFTAQIPLEDDNSLPILHLGPVCACQDFAGWADAGAPSIVRPAGTCGL